ncbi:type II secretion system F family protein [Lignipirellula cremea]|uniref:Type IV pilin biogenesis protein n=1 Tax=Lignipirellula cremea TaxID=2528010 RepID=A0A518DS93_9BACT|nr:type II secretion system F family protein [Lignipirellula cremea]QDU94705.1 type IV pilin biogenesis protein [Lignipirellula cremea]
MAALLPVGIALLLAIHLLRLNNQRMLIRGLQIGGWVMVNLGLFGVFLSLAFPLAIFYALFVPFFIWDVRRLYWRSELRAIFATLAVAAEKGASLPATLDALGAERHDTLGRRLQDCCQAIRGGQSLRAALNQNFSLPLQARVSLRLAELTGNLASSLRIILVEDPETDAELRKAKGRLAYFAIASWIAIMAVMMLATMSFRAAPWRMVEEFGLPPAGFFRWTLAAGEYAWYWVPLFLLALLIAAYAGAVLSGIRLFRPRAYETPLLMSALGAAMRCGLPLTTVLPALRDEYPHGPVRRALDRAGAANLAGQSWTEALRQHRLLGDADTALLEAASRVRNLPWACDQIAHRHAIRRLRTLQWVAGTLAPLVLLLLACVVGIAAIESFSPLVHMITNLA